MIELTASTIPRFLAERGVVVDAHEATVESLSGGFINNVFRVTIGDVDYVLKQSLPISQRAALRADVTRGLMEANGLRAIRAAVGADCPIPTVVDNDPENFVILMTAAPRSASLYEVELLRGCFHAHVPGQIGRYAAMLHEATLGDELLAAEFSRNPGFNLRDQGIRSAIPANPDLGRRVEAVLDRVKAQPEALSDADITPKNVLVHGDSMTKLDFECLTFGDTAFDLGIIAADVILLAFPRPDLGPRLVEEARRIHASYVALRPTASSAAFTQRIAEYIAVMMLGRVDGDFVPAHIAPHRDRVNSVARSLLSSSPTRPDDLFSLVEKLIL